MAASSIPNPLFSFISPPFPTLYLPFFLFSFSLLSIFLLLYTSFKRLQRTHEEQDHDVNNNNNDLPSQNSISELYDKIQIAHQLNCSTQFSKSVLLEDSLDNSGSGDNLVGEDESQMREKKKKKKKRKGKKKKEMGFENGGVKWESEELGLTMRNNCKEELVCLYPFTSSCSATQRKIKQEYDQLVKCNETKGLTLAQVGQFVNCLVEARKELTFKSECVKRKFAITKALLQKADRSSFDRLRKQIYKLELEKKRLEEDAFVYNWLQHQLKLSPAYNKMIEIGAHMELKAKAGELTESPDSDQNNISFEEFLAQEKKDAFWQKYSKPKSTSG